MSELNLVLRIKSLRHQRQEIDLRRPELFCQVNEGRNVTSMDNVVEVQIDASIGQRPRKSHCFIEVIRAP
jgi:hypothetical protein